MKSPTVIDKVLAAVNSGNTNMFLDLFAEDGEVDDWGSIYRGRAEIKTWSDRELVGAKARLTIRAAQVHHDEVSMIVHIGDAGFRGLSRFAFTMEGDRIRRMTITCA
ncbi:nuclear transport factor 2 family protein [Sinorhizobium meliloti]|uniref:Polyketide cyclase n=1 Tax=Rhizobium meliloti TaxID=382 RepID=A0A2J0YTH4_RHIML|nr:nuclear transport factor 2 family protein [Sinorhizobium meliloti]PJR08779.1 polyketide cyclase [Sinorhizobium meliloti]